MITVTERRLLSATAIAAAALAAGLIVLGIADAVSARLSHVNPPAQWAWSFSGQSQASGMLFFANCAQCHSITEQMTPVISRAPAAVIAAVVLLGALGAVAAALVAVLAVRARTGFSQRLSTVTWLIAGTSLAAAITEGVLTQGLLWPTGSDRLTTLADPVWGLVGLVAVAALAACVAGILFGLGGRLQRDTEGLV